MKTNDFLMISKLFLAFLMLFTVHGYDFDYDSPDYEFQPRRKPYFDRFQREDVGFMRLREHKHHPFMRHRSAYMNDHFHAPPFPSEPFPPRTFLSNAVDLFRNGLWFDGRRSFHDGYGSRHTHNWNTHKWRKERYGQIAKKLHGYRKNYESWIGVNPELTLLDMFPKLKQYAPDDLKRCYHASYDNEHFDIFNENLGQAFEHYYKFYPENFQEEKHSWRIKNLYRNFCQITKSIIHCMENPKKYRIGFTELSDLSDDEYSKLLGAMTDPKELLKKYRNKPHILKGKTTPKPSATTTPTSKQKTTTAKPKVDVAPIAPEHHCIPKSKAKLPIEFSWRKLNKTTPAKYQGGCGSCWSFATLATIESAYLIKNKTKDLNFDLSEQELLRCVNKNKDGCFGGTSMDVFNYILNNKGVHSEQSVPYNITNTACAIQQNQQKFGVIDDYCARGNLLSVNGKAEVLTDQDIQRVIYEFGPVYTTIDAKDLTFKHLLDGVYENSNCSTKTNHAVTIVGWDNESWHVKNSWGVRWANGGYFRMKRNGNTCGIRNYITFPIVH